MKKKVTELKVGDKLDIINGDVQRITKIHKGWLHNSKFIEYANGEWSCLFNTDIVTLA